uniref:Dbuz/Dlh n=4 Tax=Drosophila buzzatii TaxID=7264 RepID=C9QNR8_DROBU|nr:Dbuz/Dlh [Drosophila buzzatii]
MPVGVSVPLSINSSEELMDELARFSGINTVKPETISGLKVKLEYHQAQALGWMHMCEMLEPFGGILADDTGLGSTWTIIAWLLIQKLQNQEDTHSCYGGETLIVCPKSILSKWVDDIQAVAGDQLKVYMYYGKNRDISEISSADIVITSYTVVKYDWNNDRNLLNPNWRRVILDEAQAIRNIQTERSKAISALKSRFRWAVTGSPIQNSTHDFMALLGFLFRGPIKMDRCLCLRRTISDVQTTGQLQNFPQLIPKEIKIELNEQERILYNKVRSKLDLCVETRTMIHLVRTQRLQQLCSHPYLIRSLNIIDQNEYEGESTFDCSDTSDENVLSLRNPIFHRNTPSTKISRAIEIINEHVLLEKKKIIVVSQSVALLEILNKHLYKDSTRQLKIMTLTGRTPQHKIGELISDFNESVKPCILLISLKLAETGLNLNGAKYLLFMDLHWNPHLEPQSAIHRLGQQNENVIVFQFVCKDTVDDHIQQVQQTKLSLAFQHFKKYTISKVREVINYFLNLLE